MAHHPITPLKLEAQDSRLTGADGLPIQRETLSAAARHLDISRRTVQRHAKKKCWIKDKNGLVIMDYLLESLNDPNNDQRGWKRARKRPQKVLRLQTPAGKILAVTRHQIKTLKAHSKIRQTIQSLPTGDQILIAEKIFDFLSPQAQVAARRTSSSSKVPVRPPLSNQHSRSLAANLPARRTPPAGSSRKKCLDQR
jgi:hypothetical protein